MRSRTAALLVLGVILASDASAAHRGGRSGGHGVRSGGGHFAGATRFVPRATFLAVPVAYFPTVYYAPPPVYYTPPWYADPPPPAVRYRYYCPDSKKYYPEVNVCSTAWLKVVPERAAAPR